VTAHRVETKGSWWLIDDAGCRYCRFPKTEAGRERPEWGDETAGALRDAVWHSFTGRWCYSVPEGLRLVLAEHPDGKADLVTAPCADEDHDAWRAEVLSRLIAEDFEKGLA